MITNGELLFFSRTFLQINTFSLLRLNVFLNCLLVEEYDFTNFWTLGLYVIFVLYKNLKTTNVNKRFSYTSNITEKKAFSFLQNRAIAAIILDFQFHQLFVENLTCKMETYHSRNHFLILIIIFYVRNNAINITVNLKQLKLKMYFSVNRD